MWAVPHPNRLFAGVRFDEVEGDILYVANDEESAAEMEDNFALHISKSRRTF